MERAQAGDQAAGRPLPDGDPLGGGRSSVHGGESPALESAQSRARAPSINSLVVLQDGDTGLPLAVIDGNWITAVRTAGLSAVAAQRFANPQASAIAFIGCGVQAQSHLHVRWLSCSR
jgi:hypothetical protein